MGLVPGLVLLVGCGETEEEPTLAETLGPEIAYDEALHRFSRGLVEQASEDFRDIHRTFPYAAVASRALLMSAFTNFYLGNFPEAEQNIDFFIESYPTHQDIAYAFYLRAMIFYEQIESVRHDVSFAIAAAEGFGLITELYPDTPYALDARSKRVLAFEHIAGHEMEVGRFYQKKNRFVAALKRFQTVAQVYDSSSHTPEALYRQMECYKALGRTHEVERLFFVLIHNYSQSSWYPPARGLFLARNAPG